MKKLVFLFGAALLFNITWAQTNPVIGSTPTPVEEKSNAAVKFETTSHSFGTVIEGQIATYDFKFTNIGTDPLVLSNVTASCGCTTPKWPREAIAPGQSAVVPAEYNSNGRPGTFNKNIFVKGNGGDVTLTISGNVVKEPEKPLSPIIINK